ncbi:hypothetical protein PHLH6_30330 [Pseudomonas sp. Seg1]|uniref:hypothetical protein n=1 Tax=Pseudomonas sp. Seg1 TaxID=2678259 RepID=UPI001BB432AA|nr:hypothetical protein [Pseudomonas sp. Seg1]BBP71029.1 hypothetical protein PHLH6_30330 [Pseudomonas sp. Seg1]
MSSKSPFLFPDIDFDNATLALRPLVIPGMVDPIQDGDGGINLKVVEDSDAGILCVIPAYIGMHVGDKHVIYWDKQSVFTKEVEADEVDFPLFFYLPVAIARPGWAEECHYQLTRFGGTAPDDPAVSQRLLVKLTRPGGRDDHPNDPDGHGKLFPVSLPPEVVQQGIDAEWAKKGVPVTVPFYPDMAVRDTVLVKWGSTALAPHTVTQDEVDHKTPIVIIADQAAILAGGDNDALVLRYDIHDEVWNWTVRHSQSARVRVEAGAWRLGMPIIKEAINGVITIKDLNKLDITVQVKLESADFELGDTVTMSWIGTPLNGKPLIHTESKSVVSIPSILEFKVPYAQIRAIAMGLGDASYVLTKKNGAPPLSSKRAFAEVIGDVSMLPEPTIRELFGDTLEPDEAQATVDVSYPDIANGDLINLIWAGTRAGGQSYRHEAQHTVSDNEARQGLVTLYVTNEHIRVLDQGRLDLSYRVSNDKVALYGVIESERLLVNVAHLHATLPVPKVEEADPPDGFKAKALYGSGVESAIRELQVVAQVTPSIDNVTDSKGPVWQGGITFDRSVTVTGKASPNQKVRLRDGTNTVHEPTANASGVWTQVVSALTVRAYSLTALALYGDGPVSAPPRTFNVAQAGAPSIDNVTDSKGPVVQGGTTFDRSVTVTGTASPNQKVRLRDGNNTLHEPTANGSGVWTQVVSALTVKAYSLTALALYGDGPVSTPPRTFTVAQAVTPTITNITDSKGTVAPGGITFDRTVTVTGTASPNQKVRLLDGSTALHEPTANGSGVWTQVVTGLSVATHSFKAKALYGSGEESAVRTLIVTEATAPTLTSVKGSPSGIEIPNAGLTIETAVTLSGNAAKGQKVEIFVGATSKGQATADATSGIWTLTVTGLSVAAHSFTAKAMYAPGSSSGARTLTVIANVAPTLVNVLDAGNKEVPEGTSTSSTTLTLKGKATRGQQVEIFDGSGSGAVSKGKATAHVTTGEWEKVITVVVGARRLFAEALYAVSPVYSNARILTVTPAYPELVVDPSPLTLNGFNISIAGSGLPWPSTGIDPVNTARKRDVRGGVPPYTYTSSDPLVASVDLNGTVRSEGNGTATITVRDSVGQSKQFLVATFNVVRYIYSGNQQFNHENYKLWANSVGGADIISEDRPKHIAVLNTKYRHDRDASRNFWITFSTNPDTPVSSIFLSRTPLYDRDEFISLGWNTSKLCHGLRMR